MTNVPEKYNKKETPTYKILQGIKAGSLDAKSLLKEERQACVEVLMLEGYEVPSIAQLLDRSEKTIKRDRQEIWQRNSQKPTSDFIKREVAEMIGKGKVSQAHLMRLARSKDTPAKERIEAERNAWQVGKEISERLQSLGFLPNVPQKVIGEMYHHNAADDEVNLSELKKQLNQLTEIAKETGIYQSGIPEKIKSIEEKIKKLEIKKDLEVLSKDMEDTQRKGEEQNE